jgi:hypothetical protein
MASRKMCLNTGCDLPRRGDAPIYAKNGLLYCAGACNRLPENPSPCCLYCQNPGILCHERIAKLKLKEKEIKRIAMLVALEDK